MGNQQPPAGGTASSEAVRSGTEADKASPPSGLSESGLKRVLGDSPLEGDELEKVLLHVCPLTFVVVVAYLYSSSAM